MNACRSLYSVVVINQPIKDVIKQHRVDKILEECSTRKKILVARQRSAPIALEHYSSNEMLCFLCYCMTLLHNGEKLLLFIAQGQ
jgi:hypothetical protein